MKICFICEGSYPFVAGGVSSWLHDLVINMPQNEVIIWAIAAQEKQRGRYAYTIPDNVVHIEDVYLDTMIREPINQKRKKNRLTKDQRTVMRDLFSCGRPDWSIIFNLFYNNKRKCIEFLSTQDFLELLEEICSRDYPFLGFTDYFWTVRSMFLPLLYLLGGNLPEADLYHSVSAGYAGILGAMAAGHYKKPYVLTEHGIYTREREEEILRTDWVPPQFVDLWINMFHMFTRCAYDAADQVTALFQRASLIQQEIGCPPHKCSVISNGIHIERFLDIKQKEANGWIDIAAVVRIVPIKDIKTMIYAFSSVSVLLENVRLHILGPKEEDEDYFKECLQLAGDLKLDRVIFPGRVDVKKYLEIVDFTLLTSISEGQPLAVLESMAAARPAITTDVGSCRELLEGLDDPYGSAGLCVPVMHQNALTEAMLILCDNSTLRKQMGISGRNRVKAFYGYDRMLKKYLQAYSNAIDIAREKWGDG